MCFNWRESFGDVFKPPVPVWLGPGGAAGAINIMLANPTAAERTFFREESDDLIAYEEGAGIFYNSAFVLDPNGNIVCRYRKINAESRWACPGDPRQNNTFETPWGRVGVLICLRSDCAPAVPIRVPVPEP